MGRAASSIAESEPGEDLLGLRLERPATERIEPLVQTGILVEQPPSFVSVERVLQLCFEHGQAVTGMIHGRACRDDLLQDAPAPERIGLLGEIADDGALDDVDTAGVGFL